jgi:hypothetical protein
MTYARGARSWAKTEVAMEKKRTGNAALQNLKILNRVTFFSDNVASFTSA